jgi:hypothetical protein
MRNAAFFVIARDVCANRTAAAQLRILFRVRSATHFRTHRSQPRAIRDALETPRSRAALDRVDAPGITIRGRKVRRA